LGSIIDANLGLEYRYDKRLSGFLQINNLAAQRYLQFYNYPVMPIQVLAGITCKF
jgi:outer membrane receptor protein involved in Fe transport